jgi:EmrB/QacA subfamily drug resistance transporter
VETAGSVDTRKRWTLFAAVLGSGIVFLDSTIVPVALPDIGRDLPATFLGTLEGQSYVYYGYLLSLSALLILAGALSDYHGRKRMFGLGLLGFGISSILCGISPNLEFLVVARFLQGAAGALLVPGSLSIIAATFEQQDQGRAFGVWAGASAATTIAGPVVGGALVASLSWRAAFLVNLPLVAMAMWATIRHMSESRDEEASGRFHWLGAAIVALAVGGLTLGAIRGQAQEWRDPVAYVALGIGLVSALAFPYVMRHSSHPLVPLSLFRSRNFTITNVSTLMIYGAIYVVGQFTALFAIGVLNYSELGFGVATIPSTLFLALFSTRFGALADQYGARLFMTLGPALMGVGLLWFVRMPVDSASWRPKLSDASSYLPPAGFWVDFLPAFTVFGLGLMILVAPLTATLMRSVPVSHSGVASAFNNAVSRVGPQLAGALLFVVITANFYGSLSARVVTTNLDQIRDQISPLNPIPEDTPAALAAAAKSASTDAFHLSMLVSALLCVGGAVVNAWGIRSGPLKGGVSTHRRGQDDSLPEPRG